MKYAALLAVLPAALPALAQPTIDPAHKFAWQENTGWMNWRDAGNGTQGVQAHGTYLTGYIWSENVGWICVGAGPVGSASYANTSGDTAGINILAGGFLAGYAWGENIGWINFDTSSLGAQRARLDSSRFRGYAWGENIGWINLDDATSYVGLAASCYANCDGSSITPVLNANDFQCFLNKFAGGDSYANCDGSTVPPILNANDFQCFLNAYASGCS